MIYVSLFDREEMQYRDDEYGSADTKTLVEIRYLGSFSIPLQSVLHNPPKLEAIFKVNRPLALFNYLVIKDNIFLMEEKDRQEIV